MPDNTRAAKLIAPQFLECRDFGHSWKPTTVNRDEAMNYLQGLVCTRCRSAKVRVFDQDGFILGSGSYRYAQGYLVPGLGRMTREDRAGVRKETVEKYLAHPWGTVSPIHAV